MRTRLNTYNTGSRSGRALARELGVLRLRNPTRFRPRSGDLIINWGDSTLQAACKVINEPYAVQTACDKIYALTRFTVSGVPCPEFTTNRNIANGWIEGGSTVVGRHLTRGNSGRGVVLCDSTNGVPACPLYTKYIKKRDEYRVFVVGGRAVRVTAKRSRRGAESDYAIRNAANGWVFCQDEVSAPDCVVRAGLDAVRILGLDFGAADVGYNAHYDAACVYEVNTAFGLEGTTLSVVADAIKQEYLL